MISERQHLYPCCKSIEINGVIPQIHLAVEFYAETATKANPLDEKYPGLSYEIRIFHKVELKDICQDFGGNEYSYCYPLPGVANKQSVLLLKGCFVFYEAFWCKQSILLYLCTIFFLKQKLILFQRQDCNSGYSDSSSSCDTKCVDPGPVTSFFFFSAALVVELLRNFINIAARKRHGWASRSTLYSSD